MAGIYDSEPEKSLYRSTKSKDDDTGSSSAEYKNRLAKDNPHLAGKLGGSLSGRKRKGLLAVALSTMIISILGYLIHTLSGSLQELSFFNHISDTRVVHSLRIANKNSTALTTERYLIDTAGDATAKSLMAKSKLGRAVDVYNPARVAARMRASSAFEVTKDPVTGRTIYKISGTPVEEPKIKFGRLINNRREWKRFAQDLDVATRQALLRTDTNGQISELMRSRVSKAMLNAFHVKLFWWQRKSLDEAGKEPAAAKQGEQRRLRDRVTRESGGNKIGPQSTVQKYVSDAQAKIDACLADAACAEKIRQGGNILEISGATKIVDTFENKLLHPTIFGPLASLLNPVLSIAVPVCLINDGAVGAAKDYLNAQTAESLSSFVGLAARVGHQSRGDLSGEAYSASTALMGNFLNSNPEKLARNETIDTSTDPLAQSARYQNYTIFDAIFPSSAVLSAADALLFLCPYLLNPAVIYSIIGISIAAFLLNPPAWAEFTEFKNIAARFANTELTRIIDRMLTNLALRLDVRNAFARKAIANSALSFGAFTAGGAGLQYGAKMLMLSKMGAFLNSTDVNDGSSSDPKVSEAAAGIDNQMDMGGTVYGGEYSRMGNFARPLNVPEGLEVKKTDKAYVGLLKNQRSTFQRYFALHDPDSTVGRTVVAVDQAVVHPSRIATALGRIPKFFGGLFHHAFWPGQAQAATKVDAGDSTAGLDLGNYNIVQWGWTDDEIAIIDGDKTFDPLVNASIVAPVAKKIGAKYGPCYGLDLGSLQSATTGILKKAHGKYLDRDQVDGHVTDRGLCSPKSLSASNSEFGPKMVLRWRYDCSLRSAMIELLNVEGRGQTIDMSDCGQTNLESTTPTEATAPTPAPTPTTTTTASASVEGDIGLSSDTVACAPGTKDLGVVQSHYTGAYKKEAGPLVIRLCQIPSIPGEGNNAQGQEISGGAIVNSRVSGAWFALGKAAQAAGIKLSSSSSFRLADSCGGTGDGNSCAKPGGSPHQMGIAIDFAEFNFDLRGSSTTSCSGRSEEPNNPTWNWLLNNAEKFGMKQYTYEAWHWDPLPASNRCDASQRRG